jgi:hypothetical protein
VQDLRFLKISIPINSGNAVQRGTLLELIGGDTERATPGVKSFVH